MSIVLFNMTIKSLETLFTSPSEKMEEEVNVWGKNLKLRPII